MNRDEAFALYRQMLLIRRFEERSAQLYVEGKIGGFLHLYIGQEAVATGVCAALRAADYITSTHRPHGHALAKGVSARSIMAELMAKATGCCKAKGATASRPCPTSAPTSATWIAKRSAARAPKAPARAG